MKKLIAILISLCLLCSFSYAEEDDLTSEKLYVTAKLLNGRATPSKKGIVEALFDCGDSLIPTGAWSKSHEWVEVYGGETGVVWVSIKYVNELTEPTVYENRNKEKVKIRKKPFNGRVIGYVKGKHTVTIYQIVNGWGRCDLGWIDMHYLVEY